MSRSRLNTNETKVLPVKVELVKTRTMLDSFLGRSVMSPERIRLRCSAILLHYGTIKSCRLPS